jgi:hypothetical protein
MCVRMKSCEGLDLSKRKSSSHDTNDGKMDVKKEKVREKMNGKHTKRIVMKSDDTKNDQMKHMKYKNICDDNRKIINFMKQSIKQTMINTKNAKSLANDFCHVCGKFVMKYCFENELW